MKKDDFDRYSLKSNFMRQIIFRIDYKGVIDIKDFVSHLSKYPQNQFKSYEPLSHNTIDFEVTKIDDISETLSIPVKEITKENIHRFTNNSFGNDELILDISKYFSILTIRCENYETIDNYREFFSSFAHQLFAFEKFLSIKRFGLRKIGGKIFNSFEEIFNTFEKSIFNFDFSSSPYISQKANYLDVLKSEKEFPIINYRRSIEKGIIRNTNTEAFQVILDIDAFLLDENLISDSLQQETFNELLKEINNDHLFNLFKLSVTEKFLEANKK